MFSFCNVTYEKILNKINNNLDTSKLAESEDTPFKITKDNTVIFTNFILRNFNQCIIDRKFPDQLKKHKVFLSKETIMIKPTIDR